MISTFHWREWSRTRAEHNKKEVNLWSRDFFLGSNYPTSMQCVCTTYFCRVCYEPKIIGCKLIFLTKLFYLVLSNFFFRMWSPQRHRCQSPSPPWESFWSSFWLASFPYSKSIRFRLHSHFSSFSHFRRQYSSRLTCHRQLVLLTISYQYSSWYLLSTLWCQCQDLRQL